MCNVTVLYICSYYIVGHFSVVSKINVELFIFYDCFSVYLETTLPNVEIVTVTLVNQTNRLFFNQANLAIQEARLAAAMSDLNTAQAQLDEKQRELDKVQAEYDKAMAHKQMLVEDAERCRRKMEAASALISGLGGEKERWTEQSKEFKAQIGRYVLSGSSLILTSANLSGNMF